MKSSKPSPKGKNVDRSTAWSEYRWDYDHGRWWASRTDSAGNTQYDYRYPDAPTTQPEQGSIPRTPGELYNNQLSSEIPSFEQEVGTYPRDEASTASTDIDSQGADPSGPLYTYKLEPEVAKEGEEPYPGPGLTGGFAAIPMQNDPQKSFPTYRHQPHSGTSNDNYDDPAASEQQAADLGYSVEPEPGPSTSQNYQGGPSGQVDSIVALGRSYERMGITPVIEEDHDGEAATTFFPAPKRIYREPNSESYEEIDDRYREVKAENQKRFWKVGRVFMMLWTEPARYTPVPRQGGTRNGSHLSTVPYGEQAYSEIRRFVVIRAQWGNNICHPIQTYNNQGTLKPNLPAPQQHAIIYTSPKAPPQLSYEAIDERGQTVLVQERLTKDAIRVKQERPDKDKDSTLKPASRLNYSKIYTVENYVRVLNIGMIHPDSMASFVENSCMKPDPGAPERPLRHLPRSNSGSGNQHRHRRDKDQDGGGHKVKRKHSDRRKS